MPVIFSIAQHEVRSGKLRTDVRVRSAELENRLGDEDEIDGGIRIDRPVRDQQLAGPGIEEGARET
jgi:hypothetical protein